MMTTLLSLLMSLATIGPADASSDAHPAVRPGVVDARASEKVDQAVVTTRLDLDQTWLLTVDADDEEDSTDGDGIMPVALVSSTTLFGSKTTGSIRKDSARLSLAQRSPILRC